LGKEVSNGSQVVDMAGELTGRLLAIVALLRMMGGPKQL
jgi:hypothetical protein